MLSTFHRAKGLEWPVVFVAGLEDGLVPLVRAGSRPRLAEERRLLYVALTRAEQDLRCSWARRRLFGDHLVARTASPFLPGLVDAITSLAERRLPADPRPALRSVRQRLAAAGATGDRRAGPAGAPGDPSAGAPDGASTRTRPDELLEDLRRWRAAVARAGQVSPTAVITDPALAALATHRPSDRASLFALAGLGPITTDRWCDDLLTVVARHTPA